MNKRLAKRKWNKNMKISRSNKRTEKILSYQNCKFPKATRTTLESKRTNKMDQRHKSVNKNYKLT